MSARAANRKSRKLFSCLKMAEKHEGLPIHPFSFYSCYAHLSANYSCLITVTDLVFFIAGRPKAALLLWFFADFRCGALLFVVIHVIYKYKNR